MRIGSRLAMAAAVAVGVVVASAPGAEAATTGYYNTYSDVADTPDVADAPDKPAISAEQGFAAGTTYLYTVKISNTTKRSVIYRVNKSGDSPAQVMTNGDTGANYNTYLGHANDIALAKIGDDFFFYIVTLDDSGSSQLVKLRYEGATYYKVASYPITFDGATLAASGVSVVSTSSTSVSFLFKKGARIYTGGSVGVNAPTGTTIALTKEPFLLDKSKALVNGATVGDIAKFADQGFYYDAARKTLYYPLTYENRSIVLVYVNVNVTSTGVLTSDPDLSFRITSSVYDKFEIEGVGVSPGDNRLYFSTNRSAGTKADDGFHVFKEYVAS
jgi:hypothetical protein